MDDWNGNLWGQPPFGPPLVDEEELDDNDMMYFHRDALELAVRLAASDYDFTGPGEDGALQTVSDILALADRFLEYIVTGAS